MYSDCQIIADLIKGQLDTCIPSIGLRFNNIINIFSLESHTDPSRPREACT